ncbi:restriction endonuclease subunit S [Collinsella stercoris]|uniref:restriction endonuclease subunit S n=1 Tax=Collinsella stercoris TaxID=147206 RepID=UPI0026F1A5A5|nr:restriction endonuclease subunit S [Collinsella stercoris]MBS6554682.1 restriction endonuclease subunit S [Collinsella stercoris]
MKVAEVFNLQIGKTPSRKKMEYWNTGEYDWVSIKDLGSYGRFVGRTKETISELGRIESGIKQVPSNTLLMSFKLSLGKTSITTRPIYTNEAIMAFLDKGTFQFDLGYMWHQFRTKDWATGTNMAVMGETLNKKTLGSALIRLPDLRTQRMVASHLDVIQGQLEIAAKKLERLDTLVKSRFVEMFGGSGWPVATVGSLATDIRYGTSKKASDCGQFVYLRMNNMTDGGGLDFGDVKHIDLSGAELEKCQVVDGDLLFNRTNSREKVGKTAVFHAKEPMVIAGYIIRVRLGDRIKPDFLAAYMNLPTTKAMLRSIARGAVHQANINSRELSAIEVPVPPICLQDSFLSFVAEVDKSRFNLLKAYGSIIALFRVLFP